MSIFSDIKKHVSIGNAVKVGSAILDYVPGGDDIKMKASELADSVKKNASETQRIARGQDGPPTWAIVIGGAAIILLLMGGKNV